jgi:hypothetical protein
MAGDMALAMAVYSCIWLCLYGFWLFGGYRRGRFFGRLALLAIFGLSLFDLSAFA